MHRINALISWLLTGLLLFSCIEPFEPDIEPQDSQKYVVFGYLTDKEGFHQITVSTASSVGSPEFSPVVNCQVQVITDHGDVFAAEEAGDGVYRIWMAQADLIPGIAYQVRINTPSGTEIASDFDRMHECPEVDSVYYLIEDKLTQDPDEPMHGIQFYTDLNASGLDSHFFRWELEETWEYHMPYIRKWYYDGNIQNIDPPDSSTWVCWSTNKVTEIFNVSTQNLAENRYTKYPLHYINARSDRLTVLYSLLIRQYSMSADAFHFWDQLRINSQGQGGLYEEQPLNIRGNLHNLTDPDLEVLGYFGASATREKRLFIRQPEGLILDFRGFCIGPRPLGIFGWDEFYPYEFPVFFIYDGSVIKTLDMNCIDCLLQGGTVEKPSFWPD